MIKKYTYKIENLGTYTIEKYGKNKYLLNLMKAGVTSTHRGKYHKTLTSAKQEVLRVIKEDIEELYSRYEKILDDLYQLDHHMNMEELEDYLVE